MIDYTLALELKDAGFESKRNFFPYERYYCPHQPLPKYPDEGWKENMGHIPHCKDAIYFPELSELIEACGEKFHSLEKDKKGWYANWEDNHDPSFTWDGEGSTPEEAVARLLIVLYNGRNEKKAS